MTLYSGLLLKLEGHCKGAYESQASTVEVDVSVLSSTVELLKDAQVTQKQLEQAQEQLTMKPSVAKKLNDRIKALETELSITRKQSTIAELERKVARLETELRQSYSTKNFTLKSGLLDIEKRHREFIYENPAIEDLWSEVLGLLVEDKETLPAGTVIQKARHSRSSSYSRSSSSGAMHAGGNYLAGGLPERSPPLDKRPLNRVQDEIEKLEEHVTGVPLGPPQNLADSWRCWPGSINSNNFHGSFSNPAFCWYADLVVGRTATTVQQHIDTLNTSVTNIQSHLKDRGLLRAPLSCTNSPSVSLSGARYKPFQQDQAQEQQELGNPESVCRSMEGLAMSVQHLLELLPSTSEESPGGEATVESLQASMSMEFSSFNNQAEQVLSCMEQLSMAYGTHQAQANRKQHEGGGGKPIEVHGASEDNADLLDSADAPDASKEFYKQASSLTHAVQQLRALLSVHIERAQQRLRDMALPPLPRSARASAGPSPTAGAVSSAQQEGQNGLPPGTVQALAWRFVSFLASHGHLNAHQLQQQHRHLQPEALTSLEQLLAEFVASQAAGHSNNGAEGLRTAAALPPTVPTAPRREGAASQTASDMYGSSEGMWPEMETASHLQLSSLPSPEASSVSVSGLTTPQDAASSVAAAAPAATALDVDVSQGAVSNGSLTEAASQGDGILAAFCAGDAERRVSAGGQVQGGVGSSLDSQVQGVVAGSMQNGLQGIQGALGEGRAQGRQADSASLASSQHVSPGQAESNLQPQPSTHGERQQQQQQHAKTTELDSEQQHDTSNGQPPKHIVGTGEGPLSPCSSKNTAILPEDYAAELDQLRAIAAHHAELTASSQELVATLSAQHTAAILRADELEVRLAQFEKEVLMQQNENEVLTRALVEVKVAYAEKDSENMRLAQRLKRSLKNSDVSREEIEYLKTKLMAATPDQVGVDPEELETLKQAVADAEEQETGVTSRSDSRRSTATERAQPAVQSTRVITDESSIPDDEAGETVHLD